MEQDRQNNELPQGLTPDQKIYVEALQKALAEVRQRSQRYEEDWSNLFDQNKTLREENHRIQHSYEDLRIQKGGFGFKMLMLSGLGGFVTALLLCFVYLKLKPKDPHITALHNFKREHLFDYELALSKKQYEPVKTSLEKEIKNPENQPIRTELEILREVVEAAERGSRE